MLVRIGCLDGPFGCGGRLQSRPEAHLAFIVSGLGELVARLKTRSYRVVEDDPLAGYNRRYADDPFGNRSEVIEPDAGLGDDHVPQSTPPSR